MTERTKTIKGLISGQVDMGTFGLVELELLAIEKENEALRKHAVIGSFSLDDIWRMAQKYNCDDFIKMVQEVNRLNDL